tara:strand:+ start:1284 stop:1508 length:225 start_codon:yes stop_codon:yes gene_type:complete
MKYTEYDKEQKRKAIREAQSGLYAVNQEHLEDWMTTHADLDTSDAKIEEIETICKAINDCLDVLKEMLRDLEDI